MRLGTVVDGLGATEGRKLALGGRPDAGVVSGMPSNGCLLYTSPSPRD